MFSRGVPLGLPVAPNGNLVMPVIPALILPAGYVCARQRDSPPVDEDFAASTQMSCRFTAGSWLTFALLLLTEQAEGLN